MSMNAQEGKKENAFVIFRNLSSQSNQGIKKLLQSGSLMCHFWIKKRVSKWKQKEKMGKWSGG